MGIVTLLLASYNGASTRVAAMPSAVFEDESLNVLAFYGCIIDNRILLQIFTYKSDGNC